MSERRGLQIQRKVGESIFLFVGDEKIRLTLHDIKGCRVRIAILADPEKVTIRREEQLECGSRSQAMLDS